jgi:predicted anti-sigma-YlaC factor YlaD
MNKGSVDCEAVRDVLTDLAASPRAIGWEAAGPHLETCLSCRTELAVLAQLFDSLLLAAPAADPPLGFEDGVARSPPWRSC